MISIKKCCQITNRQTFLLGSAQLFPSSMFTSMSALVTRENKKEVVFKCLLFSLNEAKGLTKNIIFFYVLLSLPSYINRLNKMLITQYQNKYFIFRMSMLCLLKQDFVFPFHMINTYVNCRKVLIRMTNRSLICLETFYFLYCLFTKVWLKMNVATHALNELSCSTAHSLNCNLQKQRQHMGAIIIQQKCAFAKQFV